MEGNPEAKAAVIWALGEFPTAVDDAPYLLESLVGKWKELHADVRMQLVTASVKMLLARPAEGAPAAGKALAAANTDKTSVELRDAAATYYRLLEKSPELLRSVITTEQPPLSGFVEDESFALQDRLFEEFNTLSVCYGKPADERPKFIHKVVDENDYLEAEDADGGFELEKPLELVETPTWDGQSFQKAWTSLPVGCTMKGKLGVGLSVEQFVPEIKANKHELCCIAAGIVKDTAKIYAYSQLQESNEYLLAEILIDKNTAAVQSTFKSTNQQFLHEWARLVCANYLGFDA